MFWILWAKNGLRVITLSIACYRHHQHIALVPFGRVHVVQSTLQLPESPCGAVWFVDSKLIPLCAIICHMVLASPLLLPATRCLQFCWDGSYHTIPYPCRSPMRFIVVMPALQWISIWFFASQIFCSSLASYMTSTVNWLSRRIQFEFTLVPQVWFSTWS